MFGLINVWFSLCLNYTNVYVMLIYLATKSFMKNQLKLDRVSKLKQSLTFSNETFF